MAWAQAKGAGEDKQKIKSGAENVEKLEPMPPFPFSFLIPITLPRPCKITIGGYVKCTALSHYGKQYRCSPKKKKNLKTELPYELAILFLHTEEVQNKPPSNMPPWHLTILS